MQEDYLSLYKNTVAALLEKLIPQQASSLTPQRASLALEKILSGYHTDIEDLLSSTYPIDTKNDQDIVIDNIPFLSLCQHHILPFHGWVHIAYIPKEKILGLSRITALVDALSRKLQLQETLTQEIAKNLEKALNPKGCVVYIEAMHCCHFISPASTVKTVKTLETLGLYAADPSRVTNFLTLLAKDVPK